MTSALNTATIPILPSIGQPFQLYVSHSIPLSPILSVSQSNILPEFFCVQEIKTPLFTNLSH